MSRRGPLPHRSLSRAVGVGFLLSAILGALLLGGPASRAEAPEEDPWVHLVVLHTNDVHGALLPRSPALAQVDAQEDVGGFACLAAFVKRERAEAEKAGAHVLLLDGGDLWRGTPEGDLTRGDLVVEAVGRLRYDAIALGNHELDFGLENAARLARSAAFPWISANVVEATTGKPPPWLRPHVLLDVDGLKVGIVGLTTTDTPRIVMGADRMGLSFPSEKEVAVREAKELEGRTDLLLFVTHQGPERDLDVLKAVPRCPLIVGGHSHTRLYKPIDARGDGKAWIVQAGTACIVAGRVRLKVHRVTKEVVLESASLVPLIPSKVGVDAETAAFLAGRLAAIDVLKPLGEVVATLGADLSRAGATPEASSPAGNAMADAMRAKAGADVALTNRGGLRVSLPKGPVTGRDLYLLMPFDNTVVVVTLTGAELRSVLTASLSGERITPLEVSGVTGTWIRDGVGRGSRVTWESLRVGDAPVEDAKTYRVAVNSFLAQGGDGYRTFQKPDAKDLGVLVRDAMREHLAASPVFQPDPLPRLRPK